MSDVILQAEFFNFAEANKFALVKVHSGAKNPVGNEWQKHSSKNRRDWEQWAKDGFNIGVHAGASRLIIFDLDSKHGGIEAVRKRFDDWCHANGMAPLPHHVETPSKGQHVFMLVPEGDDAGALASDFTGKMGLGVEILTGDRQSVAPGSFFKGDQENQKPSGHYTFKPGAAIYEAPQAVLDICKPVPRKPSDTVTKVGTLDFEDTKRLYKWLAENGVIETDDEWRSCGMAARLAFGDKGFELWETVAQTLWNEPVDAQNVTRWNSFDTEATANAVTMDSIFKLAKNAKWPGTVRPSVESMFGGVGAGVGPGMAPPNFILIDDEAPSTQLPPGTPLPETAEQVAEQSQDAIDALHAQEVPTPEGGFFQSEGDFISDFVAPNYLIDSILQRGFLYGYTAPTGAGKTAVALLLTALIPTGKKLGNLDVEQGQVLYFAGENPDDIRMRWIGLKADMGIADQTLDVHFVAGAMPLNRIAKRITAEIETKRLAPNCIIVDTLAAFYDGDDDNANIEMVGFARRLRKLCELPSKPTVLVLCHPTKGAKTIEEMVPRGGGAFLNELDGNLASVRPDGSPIVLTWAGKFRGPEFTPLYFETATVRTPALTNAKGIVMPTVVARLVSLNEMERRKEITNKDDIAVLNALCNSAGMTNADIGRALDWYYKQGTKQGKPDDSRVRTVLKRLKGDGYVAEVKDLWTATPKGQKAANIVEGAASQRESAPSIVPADLGGAPFPSPRMTSPPPMPPMPPKVVK
jgi:hypothetical protein